MKYYTEYAELLIKVGVHLREGDKLYVSAEIIHKEFVRLLTKIAYQNGAALVHVSYEDPLLEVARVKYAKVTTLSQVASWKSQQAQVMVDERWAKIRLIGSESPDAYEGLDPHAISAKQITERLAAQVYSEACGRGDVAWCTAALPTEAWGAKVFGVELSPEVKEKLWVEMVKILRLDHKDPVAFWESHSLVIKQRSEKLSALQLSELHFKGGGTDLRMKCIPGAKWIGGGIFHTEEDWFIPNLPTEESFTTPDYRTVEGRAYVVRPVKVSGVTVEGAWFEFKQGEVVDYGADTNKEALDNFFASCERSRYVGEIAIVDSTSPILHSGLVFDCILYDENATSHFALGSSYPLCIEQGSEMNKSDLLAKGANVSTVHTDFMIGTPDMKVTGVTSDGREVDLLEAGFF